MAPVTASAAGVARQAIDDPALLALIGRLSEFDPTIMTAGDANAENDAAASDDTEDGDVVMNDAEEGATLAGTEREPPVDVDGLVAELAKFPRWRFQEQADLYEWIRPLNAIDAALGQLMDAHPSLLLIRWSRESTKNDGEDENHRYHDAKRKEGEQGCGEEGEKAVRSLRTILRFLSQLLRNAASKSLFASLARLSSLLAARDDEVASLAVEALASLASPPLLHRQRAPEAGQHTTALHKSLGAGGGRSGDDAEALGRLLCCARGWGGRGDGLGLLACVTAGNEELMGKGNKNSGKVNKMDVEGGEEGGGRSAFVMSAGEVNFECYCRPLRESDGGTLVSVRLSKEEMFTTPSSPSTSSPSSMSLSDDDGPDQQAEKRRRINGVGPGISSPGRSAVALRLKSTARLYGECLDEIQRQYWQRRGESPDAVADGVHPAENLLSPARLFALLSSVRLARAFHSPSTRIVAVETRLRALACVVHAHPSQEAVAAHFAAQPELVGELADLLRSTVSGGNASSGVLPGYQDGGDGDEEGDGGVREGGGSSIFALADSPVVPYSIRTLAVETLTALVARRDAGAAGGAARQTNVLAELGVGKGQYLGLLPALIRFALAALNSFLLGEGGSAIDEANAGNANAQATSGDIINDAGKTTDITNCNTNDARNKNETDVDKDIGLALGLSFLRATRPPPPPHREREERALEFVDSVLTLASAVVSVPGGTASLTDCGVIPALVSAVALDSGLARRRLEQERRLLRASRRGPGPSPLQKQEPWSDVLLKFVSAQAIQILEGAVVTNAGALRAFHELRGADVLAGRLAAEVDRVKLHSGCYDPGSSPSLGVGAGHSSDGGGDPNPAAAIMGSTTLLSSDGRPGRALQAARRVLLFSAVNCLTVVFHQHDPGPSPGAASPTGGAQLRRPGLKEVLLEIMDNVDSYGGVLAALVATFLSDVMNSDPQVVHFVHSSGLAASFLSLLTGTRSNREDDARTVARTFEDPPAIGPSAELVMAAPGVLTALSLTEAGAGAVGRANPFPALLSVFVSPRHAMPESRCLLNEMAAIVGTGLDELMRHNPSLRAAALAAIVGAMNRAVALGKELVADEDGEVAAAAARAAALAEGGSVDSVEDGNKENGPQESLELRRTRLVQHSYNLAQLLEQVLHAEDHVGPFITAGGFDALLDLARWGVAPGGRGLVAHASCLSSPSIAGVAHGTTSGTLAALVKVVASNASDPHKLIKQVVSSLESQLFHHGNCVRALTMDASLPDLACRRMLDNVPPVPLHDLDQSYPRDLHAVHSLGRLFRSVALVDWLTKALSATVRAACQKFGELGAAVLGGEWKREISSPSFQNVINRLSALHRSSMREVCHARTRPGFDERDEKLRGKATERPLVYRVRIVCQEGAIVRNGVEIDGCDSVASLEMGEVVEAYDRCINSSGVLRYRAPRGWVSELTRGAGRENITEVIDVRLAAPREKPPPIVREIIPKSRIECGIPDLRSVAASILARLHGSQSNLFASLAKLASSSIRPPPLRSPPSLQHPSPGVHAAAAAKLLASNLRSSLSHVGDKDDAVGDEDESMGDEEESLAGDAARCMYLGSQLNLLYASLFEDKRDRDRRSCNVLLLVEVLAHDGWTGGLYSVSDGESGPNALPKMPEGGGALLSAIHFVLMHGLRDMASFVTKQRVEVEGADYLLKNPQRVSRAVASSLPSALSLLRRLMSRPPLAESHASAALAKMKGPDLLSLIPSLQSSENFEPKFNAGQFTRALHLELARLSCEVWSDKRFTSLPAHVVHPWILYMGEVIRSLEEASKVVVEPPSGAIERLLTGRAARQGGSVLAGLPRDPTGAGAPRGGLAREEPFQPSEESVSRLAEMGFSRDHATEALEAAGTNRVEVAMEYALAHPPSSPGTLERRRAARERRRAEQRRREEAASEEWRRRREEAGRRLLANEGSQGQADMESNNEDGAQNQASDSNSPGEKEGAAEPKPLTEDERKAKIEKEAEEKSAAEAKEYLQSVKDSLGRLCLDIIEGSAFQCAGATEENAEDVEAGGKSDDNPEDDDSQRVIKVVSNFLLDVIRMYPDLEQSISSKLLQRLKAKLDVKSPSHCRVKSGGAKRSFAALAHASVIIFRALPKSRPLVLRQGLVGMITHCVRNCTLASSQRGGKDTTESMVWPSWLAPALLVLEVMAQPTSVALDGEEAGAAKPAGKKSEYGKVLAEHKKQISMLAKTTKNVYLAVINKEVGKTMPKKKREADSKKPGDRKPNESPASGEESKLKSNVQPTPLPTIPAFLPLLHSESAEACMLLCLQLLGLKLKKGVIDKAHLEKVCPPPTICQAVLVLLVRLCRSWQLSSSCLHMGGADLILALPGRSRFPGNSGVVTLLLRRMLEDEATLNTMMETEIRGVVAKIYKKQHPSHAAVAQPKVNLKSFMQACTPLICRDPVVFLKAAATSVKIDPSGSESSSLVSSRGSQVTLLSSEERARNAKLLSSHFASHSNHEFPAVEKRTTQEVQLRRGRSRSKSPQRASLTKKSTPTKSPGCGTAKNHFQLNGSSVNHITSLLLGKIMAPVVKSHCSEQSFLSELDYLGSLSDLVLAIAACGAAIHRFKPAKGFIIHNAISGCPNPPQTAVSYLLHQLLPQPRQAPKQERVHLEEVSKDTKSLKALAYNRTKTSQAAARLMICLVARSGEGRRRVISDLVFALSCGQFLGEKKSPKTVSSDSPPQHPLDENAKMWALRSWGELCMGLSAPKSSNAGLTNQDQNSVLSFEVVKLFLDHGAAHALMVAIERLTLTHPMATMVASALIPPLEVFTRGSVFKTMNDMALKEAEKEKSKLTQAKMMKDSRRVTFGPSQRSESSLIDDAAIENAFDAMHNLDQSMGSSDGEGSNDENMESMGGDSSDDNEIEVPPIDYSDEDSGNGSADEEISTHSSDEEDLSMDESEGESIDEDAEDDDIDLGSEEDEEEEAEMDDGMDLFDDFEGDVQDEPNNDEGDDGTEGWTRIDAGRDGGRGLGGMLLDMVQQPHGNGRPPQLANGGLLFDNVENMLSNMLRGEMGFEGLSELEDSLGIRLVRGDTRGGLLAAGLMNRTSPSGSLGNNTRPSLVHQNGPSNSGSSIFGGRGLVEFSPMEFVFGGPATGAGILSHDSSSAGSNGDDPGRDSESPSSYELFPGGAISTHSRACQPSLHPLVQSIQLPPVTALRGGTSEAPPDRNTRSIAVSGSFVAGSNGNIIRVNDRLRAHEGSDRPGARRTAQGVLLGWTDDGLPPDRSSEDFSVAFGQALNSFLQDQSQSHAQTTRDNDVTSNEESSNQEEPGRSSTQNVTEASSDVVTSNNEPAEELDASGQNIEEADTASNSQPPPAQESQSEAAAVSSAMATGLTITQQASDNAPIPPDRSILNDQANTRNDPIENVEGADDAVMAANRSDSGGDQGEDDDEENSEDEAVEEDVGDYTEENLGEDAAENAVDEMPEQANTEEVNENAEDGASVPNELSCPPDIDPEVFSSLPLEMQQEIVNQHEVAAQISESGLDPEALAALPEDMRREVIEQEQEQQRLREQQAAQPPADPANAEDMDNASFLASLAPDLRQEILLTADDAFISSLPQTLIAEANVLRERVALQQRRRAEETANASNNAASGAGGARPGGVAGGRPSQPSEGNAGATRGRRQRNGKLRVELGRKEVVYMPNRIERLGPLLTPKSAKAFLSLLYLLSPVQPQRVVQKLMLNFCLCEKSRDFFLNALTSGLLNSDKTNLLGLLEKLNLDHKEHVDQSGFPPSALIGVTADLVLEDSNSRPGIGFRRRQGSNSTSAVTVAASLPATARGSSHDGSIPPVVARRIISLCTSLCKSSPRVAFSMLCNAEDENGTRPSCLEKLLELLVPGNHYSHSATSLEQLLGLMEMVAAPLSLLPKDEQEVPDDPQGMGGREWVKVPRVVVSKQRLHLLVNTLRFESCKDASFLKINTLTRRLSRISENRECILHELAQVAEGLGEAAILDLKAARSRLNSAAKHYKKKLEGNVGGNLMASGKQPLETHVLALYSENDSVAISSPSSAVSLSTSNSELKLLRVLQMLNSLCIQDDETKSEGNPPEFISLLRSLNLSVLWDQLSVCLNTVSVLEGVAKDVGVEENDDEENDNNDEDLDGNSGKKLQNSVAGLVTRFLPTIEAFFMVNGNEETNSRVVQFAATNKILLNALLRANSQLLEKGLRAMVKMPECRLFLDFDVKRQWFKTQVRRLRQQASRRHGNFRLNLRRKHVFEDSFHAFVHRNADELRGRLHITFQNEEGVDAGGLSREFFAILAKEMFNPNYALFMSTEDGCTFQPNPNSSINPDDLRYFRFVGRIVGKAVVDGFLLDAHFTRSLYKHMLGVKPKVDDMQAIDPDYYKNLQMILEHNLEDIGLELTFSTEDHSFGRSQTIDLIPNGRKIPVTEEMKERYVDLVCQHRMTTAIEKQIKAYLEGFHEMVDHDLISIFTAKELELLISGMPDIDIHDLKKNTLYNGYRPADVQIGWFWNTMFALTRSEKAAFLQFVTGSSKVPLAGFSELQGMRGVQKFSINKASGPSGALMSAHTCFNALDLPVYKSEEEMKEKLLYAISEGSGGFGFA